MDQQTARQLAHDWEDQARDKLEYPEESRVILARTLAWLVPDGPAMVLVDDNAMSRVGVVAARTLFVLSASADHPSEGKAHSRAVPLGDTTGLSVVQDMYQDDFGVHARRRWTVTPAHGEPVSFYTVVTGGNRPDQPFIQQVTEAVGWTLPAS